VLTAHQVWTCNAADADPTVAPLWTTGVLSNAVSPDTAPSSTPWVNGASLKAWVTVWQTGGVSQILFVGGKNEAIVPIRDAAMLLGVPFVAGRWIGGTLTNFKNIRRRVERLEQLTADKESGELSKKYTKREQLLLSREAENLEFRFGGIISMKDLPGALFIVDPRHEDTAVKEANQLRIPIIALSSSDGDFNKIQFPIPGNDTVQKSIRLVVSAIADAFSSGRRSVAPTERAVEVK
jgi:small subunit ribosomal protein S2